MLAATLVVGAASLGAIAAAGACLVSVPNVVSTCTSNRWPAAPPKSPGGNGSFFVAVHTLDYGVDLEAGAPGFNLDGLCGCGGSCTPHPNADVACWQGDINNAIATLFSQVRGFVGGTAPAGFDVNVHIDAGEIGLLLQVVGYNGQSDSELKVAAFASTGTWAAGDGGTLQPPRWDGNDVWALDPGSVQAGPNVPFYSASQAYVTGGTFVALFDRFPLPASIGVATGVFEVENAVLTATLVPRGGTTYALANGVLGARAPTATLLSSLARFADPFDGGTLCGTDPVYNFAKPAVCEAADLNQDPSKDGRGFACNALSVGGAFTAEPAQQGAVHAPLVAPLNGCAAPDGAPWGDDCAHDNGNY